MDFEWEARQAADLRSQQLLKVQMLEYKFPREYLLASAIYHELETILNCFSAAHKIIKSIMVNPLTPRIRDVR